MSTPTIRLLLVGATGAVGQAVLELALQDPRIASVTALTRRALPPRPKLANAVVDFDRLDPAAPHWQVDAVICTLGTTRRIAGSDEAFAWVDRDLPMAVAQLARQGGASRFALNSSLGADAGSSNLYLRVKGEAEQLVEQAGFPSLTIVRPSLIDTERADKRPGEQVGLLLARLLRPAIPKRYRPVTPQAIARALLDGVIAGAPGRHIVESGQLV
jgi:uncharacterized protein YbjT (DUF2867 family)